MFTVRRHDLSPRVEMTPLIDVIFLLLTFFIYSLVMMVRAELLPVTLTTLTTGESAAQEAEVLAITIDRRGQLHLNRQPIEPGQLDKHLKKIAAQTPRPKLFLAMEADTPHDSSADATDQSDVAPTATVDRGPLLIHLIDRVRDSGINDFNIVGEPEN
jgi:biopolymer transport protein ExbD